MTPRPPHFEGPFLIAGLGISGSACARALRDLSGEVLAVDNGKISEATVSDLRQIGVEVHPESDGVDLVSRVNTLVKSPGMHREVAVVRAAIDQGVDVVGELEVAWRLLPNYFIAVTGSNGKTTTVEWIGHIFRTASEKVTVAGNVGTALSSLVGNVDSDTTIVCEASSFQLEDCELFAPDIAVLLNLGSDHLDRHGNIDNYHSAKLRMFKHQTAAATALLPEDLDRQIGGEAQQIRFGDGKDVALSLHGGALWHNGQKIVDTAQIGLAGTHNYYNALAAAGACLAYGISPAAVAEGLRTFTGIPHRFEEVALIDGVRYINDSKATNIEATAAAMLSFKSGVHLILGGVGKNADFRQLRQSLNGKCEAIYLIGEDGPQIGKAIANIGTPLHDCATLDSAVIKAREIAKPGETVLLAPACASYDQYSSFVQRGDHFRSLVEGLNA